jgi:hypothetical protein
MKRIIFTAVLIIALTTSYEIYAQGCESNPMHGGTITPFEIITLGLPSPLEPAPLDVIHIHQKKTGQQYFPFQGGPGIRLSYGLSPDLTFGQLALIQDTNINSTFASVGDLLLRAGCSAKDLVLLTQNNQSAIRFVTSHPETSVETERMTILNNGNVGIRNSTPFAHLSIGNDFGMMSNTAPGLGWKEINFNCAFTNGANKRTAQGPSARMLFSPDNNKSTIWLCAYPTGLNNSLLDPVPNHNGWANQFFVNQDEVGIWNAHDGTLLKSTTSRHSTQPNLNYFKNKVYIGKESISAHPPFDPTGSYMLAVNGSVIAKELIIDARAISWSDFVFNQDYDLMPLDGLEKSIQQNKHLPGIPSEKEIKENGIVIGEFQAKLLQKIEELTLYVIHLNKENEILKNRVTELEQKN